MRERKSYGQFCGLARSLDRVGDRWTLLIVRELLLGDRSFKDLEHALAGISPSLLTQRLSELADDGLVARNDAPPRSKSVLFGLTDEGRALEPVIIELIRWGTRWMLRGPGDDRVDARWAPLALKALLEDRDSGGGRIHLEIDGVEVTVDGSTRRRHVISGRRGNARATVTASLPVILAVAVGATRLSDSGATVLGDPAVASALLSRGNART